MDAKFAGLDLEIAPGRVFTPRAATERLVDAALAQADGKPLRVADVGTGSGAIAVAVAVKAPRVEVWASDRNGAAVDLARRNADRHGVGDRVHVREGNLLEPLDGAFDVIVANLPYLPDSLHRDEYDDEPADAIYAPGDGLCYYRRILGACEEGKLVIPGGKVLLQFHRDVLEADCWQLKDLRARLDEMSERAA